MKLQQLFTWLLSTAHAVFNAAGESALPDCTGPAIADKPIALAPAAVAIDILGFEMKSVLFRVQGRGFLSGCVVIIPSSQEGGTVGTNQSAVCDHLRHGTLPFPSQCVSAD